MTDIKTAAVGRQTVTVDGHEFTVDFDDIELVRAILELAQTLRDVEGEADTQEQVCRLVKLSDEMKAVIDHVLGEGAHDTLFGKGKRPILRSALIIKALEGTASKAYDAILADFNK